MCAAEAKAEAEAEAEAEASQHASQQLLEVIKHFSVIDAIEIMTCHCR